VHAIKPRRAEFTVTGSNSFVLCLSFFLSLPFSLSIFLALARTPPWRGSYRALWSESWDRGLAGSHDRWGFGLTPLVWTEPMVPPARGTILSLLLLLTLLHSVFLFLHSSPSLSFFLSFFFIYTISSPASRRENMFYRGETDHIHESATIDNDLTRTKSFFLSALLSILSLLFLVIVLIYAYLCRLKIRSSFENLRLVDITRP